MPRLTIILIAIGLQLLSNPVRSQIKDTTDWRSARMDNLYRRYTPLEYLDTLRADFRRKDNFNYFVVTTSPIKWVKEEHIPGLLKLIYSNDSTKSIMSVYSSYLTNDKFSSIGREAQNLIESFRTKTSYPICVNSYGPPDEGKAKELQSWWAKYKLAKP